ncbi:MAG: SGNH/GDSL hydrolase family protein [Chloroflexi bacterium]|nr:SGNH/GDSL hydrolase family protein [Chloroflexota bacterium]
MAGRGAALAIVLGLSLLLTAASPPPVTVYLALGDSIAAGSGASRPERSYVGQVLAWLRRQDTGGGVRLSLYAGGGATSDGLRRWQAPAAIDELTALRRGERPGFRLGPLTITIGANDLLHLATRASVTGAPPAPAEVRAAIGRVEANLSATVDDLLAAGGGATRITLTTYYDPWAGRPGAGPAVSLGFDAVAELNRAIVRVAERYPGRVHVARVDRALPVGAAISTYLADPIHPNDRGHAAIADVVTGALAHGA